MKKATFVATRPVVYSLVHLKPGDQVEVDSGQPMPIELMPMPPEGPAGLAFCFKPGKYNGREFKAGWLWDRWIETEIPPSGAFLPFTERDKFELLPGGKVMRQRWQTRPRTPAQLKKAAEVQRSREQSRRLAEIRRVAEELAAKKAAQQAREEELKALAAERRAAKAAGLPRPAPKPKDPARHLRHLIRAKRDRYLRKEH